MSSTPSRAIHWFRRDLRLTDNLSLHAACEKYDEIIPVYILSDWQGSHLWTGPKRQKFLSECLASLSANISHLTGKLIIRRGEAVAELLKLVEETGAEAIYYNSDVDPFGKSSERALADRSPVPLRSFQDAALHGPEEILKGDGTPYRVYTPFSKRWLAAPKPKPVARPRSFATPEGIDSLPLPDLATWGLEDDGSTLVEGGEKAARTRMKEALAHRIDDYTGTRDTPSVAGTSRLSQDLRWGTLSIRELYQKSAQCGSEQYLRELGWREFYFQILHHFPEVLGLEFNADWRGLPWHEPDERFDAWKSGQTGFPIIDAGVRQLLSTGFMHNRVRMIVAMFLTKDLHLDWRLGEQFFAQHLLDGEIGSNNGGWQWSAGTGADAAPYFRIQNPWTQSKRHDPNGDYVRRWVPELKDVETKLFFEPPTGSEPLAPGYPMPILDHRHERDVTLAIFKKHRESQK